MRRFTTKPLTSADLKKMLRKALHELGEKSHLNPETFGIRAYNFNNSLFSKGFICRTLCWEPLADIFLKRFKQKYFQKNHHKERLDPVSPKKKCGIMTTVDWKPKKYKQR